MSRVLVTVAIPALNEAVNIGRCIASIRQHVPPRLDFEILVGDHGSSDGTPAIAAKEGAKVLAFRGGTVGELRNRIVAASKGSILVFLDADTTVTPEWGAGLAGAIESLQADPKQFTGSMCSEPDSDGPFVRFWSARLPREEPSYLGTGHMIVPATLFRELQGFTPGLRSGEDYDFCMRAKAAGATLVVRPELRVLHHDYPRTAMAFIRRERWHGSGDFQSIGRVLSSKVALAALLFLALQIGALVALIFSLRAFLALEGVAALLVIAFSFLKFRGLGLGARLANIGIFYLYLIGRCLSATALVRRSARTGH